MSSNPNQNFYLGRVFDTTQAKTLDQPVLYDPANLTTHAVITGMTGSGKTGLGIDILEEAALQGIPAIIIDPKGDLTNLLLHFPELAPADFEPWLDAETARRLGKPVSQLAEETASAWQKGLDSWGMGKPQLLALQAAVEYGIFTPGSSAGQMVNILSSLTVPDLPWNENREILREKIATIATAMLSLVGMEDIDPLRSREHILLANLLENAWSQGKSLDLTELILQTQKPPMDRLGVFPMESFFPEKDRFALAMLLNNFMAAPSFQTWLEGQSLDIPSLLYNAAGKPRHNIFYIAHLNDAERMFFVTLLFAAIESWMRAQRGTGNLRLLIYFDEITGYLPPVRNPPSRNLMLRMLKQARAFGVSLVLASQNPVDVDYKALSNAGTWFIGRLQTEQDKQRLLDGLQSASAALDRTRYDRLLSGLEKRVFLLHNVNNPEPIHFQTRWTMNFLAGPMTRAQIPALLQLAQSSAVPSAIPVLTPAVEPAATPQAATPTQAPRESTTSTLAHPAIPAGMAEVFLQTSLGVREAASGAGISAEQKVEPEGVVYHPALLAQAEVRYLVARYNLDYSRKVASLVDDLQGNILRWEEHAWQFLGRDQFLQDPLPQSRFVPLPAWLGDPRRTSTWQKDFIEWVYRSGTIRLRVNTLLKVYAGPEVSSAEFHDLCSQAARQQLETEQSKVADKYEKKISTLQRRISLQESEVSGQKEQLDQRRIEEMGTNGELLLSMFSKRKRSLTTSLTKRRLTSQAKSQLDQDQQQLDALNKELETLETASQQELAELKDKWAQTVGEMNEVPLIPQKKDIYMDLYAIAWMPFYLIQVDGQSREIPAFTPV